MMVKAILVGTHLMAGAVGVMLGIYLLPILMAPAAPSTNDIQFISQNATYTAEFSRDRQDSDFLHWGEGKVSLSDKTIALEGQLAPGPDYRLYLSPHYLETEDAFRELKPQMVEVGMVKTFDNFMVKVPPGIKVQDYNTVIVWCEAFEQYISSAQYQSK